MGIRTKESTTSDVFVDVNDLIIELMKEMNNAPDNLKPGIKAVIDRLTNLRNKSHGIPNKI